MLKYKMVENTSEYVKYIYFPDSGDLHGEITVRKSDNEIISQIVANNDDFKLCLFKMYRRIKDFIEQDNFKENGIIAWY